MKTLIPFFSLFLFVLAPIYSQSNSQCRIVEGKVIDAQTHKPMIGATIYSKLCQLGTYTDIDGKFSIELPDSCTTFEATYTGYHSVTLVIQNQKQLLFKLESGAMLEEVEFTLDLLSIGNQRIQNRKHAALSGKVAGFSPSYRSDGVYNEPSYTSTQWNTENYDLIQENNFHSPEDEALSTFSIDVDGASYSNMRRYIHNGQLPPRDAIRIEEMVNYFHYDYPNPKGKHPFSITTEMSECPWNSNHNLVHIGLQGKMLDVTELPASNLVFLVDVSGSMRAPNKLTLLKKSFSILIDQLRPQDRVAIVVYAGASGLVLPSTSGEEKGKILQALENLSAGGSTAGAAGIKLAYKEAVKNFIKEGNNRVILATDGDFNVGVSSDAALVQMIEEKRKSGVFLTVLGFGVGNYKDNKMQKLANHGNGNHAYIDNIMEARKVFVNEFGGTLFTIAKDVKIQVEFNPDKVQAYRLIGYENRMLEKEDFNDDLKDAGEIGAGHTVTALYEIIPHGIESSFLKKVDKLKYQKNKKIKKDGLNSEWMHVKFRYKEPDGDESVLLQRVITDHDLLLETSDNFRWAAGIAAFGLVLRDSEYKSEASFELVNKLTRSSLGNDPYGYRHEFIGLLQSMNGWANR